MTTPIFVARESEMQRLDTLLALAKLAKPQVVFIAGEAGTGKTSLVTEFIRRVEDADPDLIASIGECNAQTGIADPYLPFRQVLTSLTSDDQDDKNLADANKAKKVSRWREFVQISTKTLIMLGPDLVGIFVPGGSFITRIGTTIALNSNLAGRLSEQIGKKSNKESPPINPALDQEKIFEQYTQVLTALSKDRTMIVVLDDLQWADSGSINLLFHLARQIKDGRLLLIGTYRPDDLALGRDGNRHPLEPILNELKRYMGDITIDLSHSQASEGRSFVDALVDAEPNHLDDRFRDELFNHTGGHPLFTVELLRALQERGSIVKDESGSWIQAVTLDWNSLPARIEGVIGERIARLPTDLHETLSIASIIGVEFIAQVVAAIQKIDERQIIQNLSRELDKRYMLVSDLGEIRIGRNFLSNYQFTHALIQQYLYDELSHAEQRILHDEIAQTLENLYGDQSNEIALQLAHHYEIAGNEDKAITYLTSSGDSSYRAYAYTEATTAYSRALELQNQSAIQPEELIHIYRNRGRVLELNGQYEEALQNYDEMLTAAQKRHDRGMELAAKVATSTLYSTPTPLSNVTKAQELCDETLKLSIELGDRVSEAKVLWNMQLMNLLQNKAENAIEFGEKSLAITRELNLREQMAYVLSDLGWAYNIACQFQKASERLEEGTQLWRELDNKPMLSNNLNTSLFQLYWTGDDTNVLNVAEEVYQLSNSIKEVWNQASARNFQGRVWLDHGEIDKSIAALKESISLMTQGNFLYDTWYNAILGEAYAELGGMDLAMDVYREHRIPNADLPYSPSRTGTLVLYALIELANNQVETASATLAACQPDVAPWECLLEIANCRLHLAQDDISAATVSIEKALNIACQYNLGQYLPEALFLKGKCLVISGDLSQAKMTLEGARDEATKLGSRHLLWQIYATLADIETDPTISSQSLSQAREIVGYIADHISPLDLKQSFLQMTDRAGVQIEKSQ